MSSQTPDRRPGELVFALLIVVFSAVTSWLSYGISGFTGKTTAGVFPMIASGVMMVSSVVIFVSATRLPATPKSSNGFLAEILTPRHLIMIGFIVAYVLLMPLIGFVASSAVFLFCSFQFLWRKNPLLILVLTGATLAIIYVIFREVFQVVLPQGTLLRGFF
jgi:putative tricarboxylic transport membrane protein